MSLARYQIGFFLSILLTLVAFGGVWEHVRTGHVFPSHELLYPVLAVLALAQLFVQFVFFFHIKEDGKYRFNAVALALTLFIVFVLVGGTLWIMNNLDHNMQMNTPLQELYPTGDITPQTEAR